MIIPLYKGKRERTECINCRGTSLLSVVEEIYTGILLGGVRKVTEGLIDDEQGFSEQGECVYIRSSP